MNTAKQILADIALEQSYKHEVYWERRGIKGVIEWWAQVRHDTSPDKIDLVINTPEKFDRIILNGSVLPTPLADSNEKV